MLKFHGSYFLRISFTYSVVHTSYWYFQSVKNNSANAKFAKLISAIGIIAVLITQHDPTKSVFTTHESSTTKAIIGLPRLVKCHVKTQSSFSVECSSLSYQCILSTYVQLQQAQTYPLSEVKKTKVSF